LELSVAGAGMTVAGSAGLGVAEGFGAGAASFFLVMACGAERHVRR
jgi:hypothetical protein